MSVRSVRLIGLALLVVSLLAVLQSCLATRAQQDFVECQARYNDINNARTRILTATADQERASSRRADDALAALFGHPAALTSDADRSPKQRAEIEALARIWVQAVIDQKKDRDDADKARADNPVPPPPSELCGEPAKP